MSLHGVLIQGFGAGSKQQRDVRPEWAMVEGWGVGMWAGGLGQMLGTANFPWSKRLMGGRGSMEEGVCSGEGSLVGPVPKRLPVVFREGLGR